MARGGNMIVTVVAQTKKFQQGLKDAGGMAQGFGKIVGGAMNMALGALGLLAGAIVMFLPNFIKMGEEARKSELRLGNIAKQMGLFGNNTDKVTKRISKYAEEISFATGVDDELIRSAQAIMLTFKELGDSADDIGGPFDRATKAAVDLAAAGFGEVESNAVQLGKALQDPITGLTALRKAGVTFTDAQREQIQALVDSNKLLEAQDLILDAIETQVGGTAEAIASSTDKMNARFESVVEELSLALLPAVDEISEAMIDWLDSVEGKEAIKKLTDELINFGEWIASPDGKQAIDDLVYSLKIMADTLSALVGFITAAADGWQELVDTTRQKVVLPIMERFGAYTPPGTRSTNGAYPGAAPAQGQITVNVNGVVSGPATSRTVLDAVKEANRLGQR
jgi:2C-methyl-D-erythritol 2,4-cyclodiphosphate synthase